MEMDAVSGDLLVSGASPPIQYGLGRHIYYTYLEEKAKVSQGGP